MVVIYGAVAQSLLAILIVTLWAGFLKHRQVIVDSAIISNEKTALDFFKAATGGSDLTWRQYLIPLQMTDLPKAYHFVWFLAVGFVVLILHHWFAGFGWLGYQVPDYIVLITAVCTAFIGYFIWLRRKFIDSKAA
jgi:hypothetical protein